MKLETSNKSIDTVNIPAYDTACHKMFQNVKSFRYRHNDQHAVVL